MLISRRKFLGYGFCTLCAGAMGMPRISLAAAPGDNRFVYIFMRGAMDGLYSVQPYGDPGLAKIRPELTLPNPGTEGGTLKLDGTFALHPALTNMHALFQNRQLTVFHAISSPYRDRSHFDGQNLVENGTTKPQLRQVGWINEALQILQKKESFEAVALGNTVPLSLQGPGKITSWSPSSLPNSKDDIVQRLNMMYTNDAELKNLLMSAQDIQSQLTKPHTPTEQKAADGDNQGGKLLKAAFTTYMQAAAKFMKEPNGPKVATVDLSGFDSHAGQTNLNGSVSQSLKILDYGLNAYKEEMGDAWNKTVVLIVTEFGRTVRMNGTNGTDHGTGTAAFLAGGAVNGGKVLADWPGLAENKLYQNRDLYPTADIRAVEAAVLRDHLGIAEADIYQTILPGANTARQYNGKLVV